MINDGSDEDPSMFRQMVGDTGGWDALGAKIQRIAGVFSKDESLKKLENQSIFLQYCKNHSFLSTSDLVRYASTSVAQ